MITQNESSYIIHSLEEEIKRVSTELHEGIAQTLYSLYNGLQFLEKGIEDKNIQLYLHEMINTLEKTIEEVRLLSVELHPLSLTTLGLVSAIDSYVKLFTATCGIKINVKTIGEPIDLPKQTSISLFRICQEALVNTAKYADTTDAAVTFIWQENKVTMEIRDFGKGFDLEKALQKRSGLAAMKERIQMVGGVCNITSKQGKGTQIVVSLCL